MAAIFRDCHNKSSRVDWPRRELTNKKMKSNLEHKQKWLCKDHKKEKREGSGEESQVSGDL